MVIALGGDHAGFLLKEKIKSFLSKTGFKINDFGTHSLKSCDYPDIAFVVSSFVSKNEDSLGILICGTGIGMSIAANRIPKVRAALCLSKEFAELSRRHNHANILCLPGRFLEEEKAYEIVDVFLKTKPEGGRHKRRVEKLG